MRKRVEETAEMWELREMERAEREREGDIAARGLRGCEGLQGGHREAGDITYIEGLLLRLFSSVDFEDGTVVT